MKNKFIKSTLILILGGFLTKILGMLIKIIVTRNISVEAMANYMLVIPSYNLFITIVSGGLQIAVSKLISENKLQKKKIIINALIISMTISILLIILVIILAKPIAILLHNEELYIPILSSLLSIPFIGISNVLKGYFFGQNKMHVQVISNFLEQIIRIIMFITILPRINNELLSVTFIIGSNLVNEFLSVIILSLFINNKKLDLKDIKIDNNIKKEILKTSIPSTISRIIGTISYFFEPIIITNFLLLNGYSKSYIKIEYGIITGYVMQLLLLPSFFSMAISQSIIPLISNAFINKKYNYIKKKIKEIILLSFMIGFIYILILLINPSYFMKLIYNQNEGINYLKQMSIIFILLYIQSPLSSILQSINKAKEQMFITTIGVITKFILTIIFSYMHFGIYAYIYPMLLNIIFVTALDYIIIRKSINSFL
ncbi:MAG: oligosaccharide flippase family protein [Bacilli bacterium]|nr:oligosaccharide flippase family protein [Bacilli bacterium]